MRDTMLNTYLFEKSGRCRRKVWYLSRKNTDDSGSAENFPFPRMPKETEFNKKFTAPFGECTVDAVVNRGKSIELYDFHSSVKYAKFFTAMNYKRAVAEGAGETVRSASIISVNPEFRQGGTERPYIITPVPRQKTEKDFIRMLKKLSAATEETMPPECEMASGCAGCEFFGSCFKLPENNIFSLVNLTFEKKLELYKSGVVTYDDYMQGDTSPLCVAQIKGESRDVVNKKEIRKFLDSLVKPIGYLDFETIMPLKPEFEGYRPHDRIVTQFSFHRSVGKRLTHAEFIGDGVKCPEEPLIKALITVAGKKGSILMYSQYEKICIETLMKRYPEYEKQLKAIADRLVDLEVIFRNKYYYNKKMRGRSSLKIVVPALFPGDEELNYSGGGVKDGADAAKLYTELKKMKKEKRKKRKEELLKYCAMDTLAMVKIIEKLREAVGE